MDISENSIKKFNIPSISKLFCKYLKINYVFCILLIISFIIYSKLLISGKEFGKQKGFLLNLHFKIVIVIDNNTKFEEPFNFLVTLLICCNCTNKIKGFILVKYYTSHLT